MGLAVDGRGFAVGAMVAFSCCCSASSPIAAAAAAAAWHGGLSWWEVVEEDFGTAEFGKRVEFAAEVEFGSYSC